jgi:hypothetical protein
LVELAREKLGPEVACVLARAVMQAKVQKMVGKIDQHLAAQELD